MRQVLVDANVFVSFLIERNESQRAAAKALIDSAGDGEIEAFVTQFAVFEVTYVLQSFYGMPIPEVAALVRDMVALPGVTATVRGARSSNTGPIAYRALPMQPRSPLRSRTVTTPWQRSTRR